MTSTPTNRRLEGLLSSFSKIFAPRLHKILDSSALDNIYGKDNLQDIRILACIRSLERSLSKEVILSQTESTADQRSAFTDMRSFLKMSRMSWTIIKWDCFLPSILEWRAEMETYFVWLLALVPSWMERVLCSVKLSNKIHSKSWRICPLWTYIATFVRNIQLLSRNVDKCDYNLSHELIKILFFKSWLALHFVLWWITNTCSSYIIILFQKMNKQNKPQ